MCVFTYGDVLVCVKLRTYIYMHTHIHLHIIYVCTYMYTVHTDRYNFAEWYRVQYLLDAILQGAEHWLDELFNDVCVDNHPAGE